MNKKLRAADVTLYMMSAIILILIASFIVLTNINFKTKTETPIMIYDNNSSLSYLVHLTPTEYYPESLGEDNQYVSSIIDKINVNYDYSLVSSQLFNYEYKYKITAVVTADHKLDASNYKNILTNEFVLKESDLINGTDSSKIVIDDNFDFDYQQYNNYIKNYKTDYTLSLDAKVMIRIEVMINGTYQGNLISEDLVSTLSMPLLDQTISITKKVAKNETKSINTSEEHNSIRNPFWFSIGLIMGFLGIILIIPAIMAISLVRKQGKYLRIIRKNLRDYSDIIVESSVQPELSNKELIEVNNFEDLIGVEQELHIPIIYNVIEYNKEVWFTISSNEQIWRFKFINNDYK